jgi:hypothetical protein
MSDEDEQISWLEIHRPFHVVGCAIPIAVEIDGIDHGSLRVRQTLRVQLRLGTHRVRTTFKNRRTERRVVIAEGQTSRFTTTAMTDKAMTQLQAEAADRDGLDGPTWAAAASLIRAAHAEEPDRLKTAMRAASNEGVDPGLLFRYLFWLGFRAVADLVGYEPSAQLLEPVVEMAYPRWSRILTLGKDALRECLVFCTGSSIDTEYHDPIHLAVALGAILGDVDDRLAQYRPHLSRLLEPSP